MSKRSATERIVKRIPLAGSLIGMVLILGSIVFLTDSDFRRVGGATGGILALLIAVWYSANPFFRNTRRYLLLRAEVVRFIGLARDLNAAVVSGASAAEVERARARLHESVERVVAAAGKTQAPGDPSQTLELFRPPAGPRGP
jgi:hypothetical protein